VYGTEITTCYYKGLLQEFIMLSYGFPWPRAPLAVLRFPRISSPSCTLWIGSCSASFPHTNEQDSQSIAVLISKQDVPYQTRGGTCCLGVSTPKIRSLADSIHTHLLYGINHLHHSNPLLIPHHGSSPQSSHITTDGRPHSSHKDTSHTQDHRDGRLVRHSWLQG
jgi:hypothetical protein